MTKIFVALALLSFPLHAFSACREASAAVNEKWDQPAVKLKAATNQGLAPNLPLETKIELALTPSAKVALKDAAKKSEGFSGLAKLSAVNGGSYEVALGERVWIDVIDAGTGASLKPGKFKKGEASTGALKTLAFPLAAGRLYFVEISAAKAPSLAMLVHAAP